MSITWKLRFTHPISHKMQEIPAQVPGNVIGDLERAKVIPEVFYGCNTDLLRPWEYVDWAYVGTFVTPKVPKGQSLVLNFRGIDTVAQLFLNGKLLGSVENMFIEHPFAVTKEDLRPEGQSNELLVKIRSSILAAANQTIPMQANSTPYGFEGLLLRRPRHSYGWDILPRIIGAGLWRPVEMQFQEPWHWTETYLVCWRLHDANTMDANLHWNFTLPEGETFQGLTATLKLQCGKQAYLKEFQPIFSSGITALELQDAQLWWPLGYGKQPLYHTTLELRRGKKLLAKKEWETGLRTLKLDRTDTIEHPDGGHFRFIVNDTPIFITGSNWVPTTAIHGENEPERVRKAIDLWTEAGCNMARVWGGGVYEDTEFFDECDRRGILVWQDFMMACEQPPATEEYMAKLRQEATSVVRKFRQHPSLALWSGDNECDSSLGWGDRSPRGVGCYPPSTNRLTREVLPQVLYLEDPFRPYIASSPFLADSVWRQCIDQDGSPEQHLWGPRHYWKSDYYTKHHARFASEMGYHGMPSLDSLKKYIPAKDLHTKRVGNAAWLNHATQPFSDLDGPWSYRLELMNIQVTEAFGQVPKKLEDFIDASQACQAEAFKFFIESFRLKKPVTGGLIWWNIIDGWPQISDAVVDYYYDKKPAWKTICASQQRVLLACDEPQDGILPLKAVNDTLAPVSGTYTILAANSKVKVSGKFSLPANSDAVVLKKLPCAKLGKQDMLVISWKLDGEKGTPVHRNHYLYGPVPFALPLYLKWYREYLKG